MLHLNQHEINQVEQIMKLLDEGFYQSLKATPLHQISEGNVEFVFSLGNTIERAKGTNKIELSVVVNSSMMEKDKNRHYFASLDEALEAVHKWHSELFGESGDVVRVSEKKPQLTVVK